MAKDSKRKKNILENQASLGYELMWTRPLDDDLLPHKPAFTQSSFGFPWIETDIFPLIHFLERERERERERIQFLIWNSSVSE